MDKMQRIVTAVSMGASLLVLIAAIILVLRKEIRNRRAPEKVSKAGVSTALAFSGFLLLAIWLLRFAVGYYTIAVAKCAAQQLTPGEEIVNSMFKAFRTFSMEEEYKDYILGVKGLIAELIPGKHWAFAPVSVTMVIYASLLNMIAPVIGGAIVLEILASVFPKIKLKWSYLNCRRPKCYFSELNAASLALAKSLYSEGKKKPILIFTDTYVDDEKEKESELLLEAKKYGAICIRDDLIHVAKTKRGDRAYYLMDENEFGNLQTLLGLAEDQNVKYIKDSRIYLFVQSDAYVQIEKQINKKLDEKKKLLKGGEKPTIVPINGYRNLVHNLFVDVPLYEPLIRKEDKTKLNLTILGNGLIGTEAFLSAYWFGQMMISRNENGKPSMDECEMTINIVSNDTEAAFWSKINYINSEIRDTVRVLKTDGCETKPELLVYNGEGKTNSPYCSVRYVKADVKVDGFWDSNTPEARELLASDYFIVALGNDADNISIADKLRRLIGKKHLEEAVRKEQDNTSSDVVIAYVVFDSELTEMLNEKNYYQCREKGVTDLYMYAFGSVEQVYSYDNVSMSKTKLLAKGTGEAYDREKLRQSHIADNNKRKNDENRNYSYWADQARAMHIRYKAFSLGLIQKSVFDHCADAAASHERYVQERCELYKKITKGKVNDDIRAAYEDAQAKRHILAWLEHRRWTAFTRTMGYQFTGEFRKNLYLNGENHKNMELKLHPCLVEAKKPELDGTDAYLQKQLGGIFTGWTAAVTAQQLDSCGASCLAVEEELGKDTTVAFPLEAADCDLYEKLMAAMGKNSRKQKQLEKLLKEKKKGFVVLEATLPDGAAVLPVTVKVEEHDGCRIISAILKTKDLSPERMTAMLKRAKAYFETKMLSAAGIHKESLDSLDKLSVEWCEETARFSITKIDAMLEALQQDAVKMAFTRACKGVADTDSERLLEKTGKDFAAAWYGIGSYDFKKYDYYTFDF